ncbi:glycoside hydrolase family 76 protein [uncultured Muribaculum sp.]|uniref:glycoside hydrolase family 76 protein n=1 Tax=uncultured Muribaculum sp. TaxID=1918613 RepID=UPI0025AF1BCE|nr:glycoside hydrolase family 76 protein [uncultured Muribaculum sp.]
MRKILYALFFLTLFLESSALESGKTCSISLGDKAIFVQNANIQNSKPVVLWSDTRVPAQRWSLEPGDDGTYAFANLYTNYYLGVTRQSAGAEICQRVYSMYLSRWKLEQCDGGNRLLLAGNEDMCLAASSNDEGAALTLVDKNVADPALSVFTITEDDITIPTAFDAGVRDAMLDGFLRQYYHDAPVGHVLGGGGWWGDAEMFETILDAFATTGDLRYKELFNELYLNFISRNGSDWSDNEYNDDITWMTLACLRAYKYFGTSAYLNIARDNFTRVYNRAHQPFGTLIWKQSQDNKLGTNSCINCPATIAACYLGQLTGDKSWYTKALTIYAGQRKLLFNANTGEVWDSRAWNSDGSMASDFNSWVSTYNQGTMLGAAVALYDYTKDDMFISDARKIYERSRDHLTNSDKIISVCQTINGDLCGFKGILMRYVRAYAESQHLEEPMLWLEKNAWHAYQNGNSNGVIWSAWLTKTAEDLKRIEGNDLKDVNNDAFGSSTAVSVAFNAHVNRMFSKNAAEGLEAMYFDDIQFTQLDDQHADGDTPNTTPTFLTNGYICFRNVDFGSEGLNRAIARTSAAGGRSYIKLYVDSISDSGLLGRSTGFLGKPWQEVSIDTDRSLTGVHDVFVQFVGPGVQFHNIRFTGDESGVLNISAPGAASMRLNGCELVIESTEDAILSIFNVAGALETYTNVVAGTTSVTVQTGIHICRLSGSNSVTTIKAIVN